MLTRCKMDTKRQNIRRVPHSRAKLFATTRDDIDDIDDYNK